MSFSWRGLLGVGANNSGNGNGGTGGNSSGGAGASSSSAPAFGSSAHDALFNGLSSLPYGLNLSAYDLEEVERLADLPPMLGMENFGNTCYVNSVLQALYFCKPFRESMLVYAAATAKEQQKDFGALSAENLPIGDHIAEKRQEQQQASAARPSTATDAEDLPMHKPTTGGKGIWGLGKVSAPPTTTSHKLARPHTSSNSTDRSASTQTQARMQQEAGSGLAPKRGATPGPSANGASTAREEATSLFVALQSLFHHMAVITSLSSNRIEAPAMASSVSTQSGGIGGGLGRKGSSRPSTASGRSAGPTLNSVPPSSVGSLAGVSLPSTSSSKLTNSSAAVTVDAQAVKKFLVSLKKANILFDTTMHQDAHEMLNFLLNRVGEDIVETAKTTEVSPAGGKRRVQDVGENGSTCVHRLFEGILTNETRCLTCESVSPCVEPWRDRRELTVSKVTSRDESFLDLSIDIDRNSSITSCLRQFSASEMLCARNKFFCDTCSGLQEAEKRMKIKKLPNVLALHLKRFKYEESIQRYVKLGYRVVFPFDLRLFNTSDDAENADRLYELQAIVVHIGAGPHHGHYIAIIRVGHRWCVFDDETISVIDDADISRYYGDTPGTGSAYVLFYQAVDIDFDALGLEEAQKHRAEARAKVDAELEARLAAASSARKTSVDAAPTQKLSVNTSQSLLTVPNVPGTPSAVSPSTSDSIEHHSPQMRSDKSTLVAGAPTSVAGGVSIFGRKREASSNSTNAAENAREASNGGSSNNGSSGGGSGGGGGNWLSALRGRDRKGSLPLAPVNGSNGATTSQRLPVSLGQAAESEDSASVSTRSSSGGPGKPTATASLASSPPHLDLTPRPKVNLARDEEEDSTPTTLTPVAAQKIATAERQSDVPVVSRPSHGQEAPLSQANQTVASPLPARLPTVPQSPVSPSRPAQGAAWAPADRPLSKKEQQKIARQSRRASGSMSGTYPSLTSPTRRSASNAIDLSTPLRAAGQVEIGDASVGSTAGKYSSSTGPRRPSTADAFGTDGSVSRRRSTLSRTFGFGASSK